VAALEAAPSQLIDENSAVPLEVDPEGVELETLDRLARLDGQRILEVGSGDGRLTYRYAERAAYVLGIDPDRAAVEDARSVRPAALRNRVQFRVARTVVPPRRRRFDIALFSWSL
jgi:cyclopropane fatty-acyl-phospholipid synthase-like methyltransferase